MEQKKEGLFSLMSRLDSMSNQFTKTDWKIVQYIKNNTESFITSSAQNLAAQIGTSDASIIRFTQKIGFSGLNEFKYTLQQEFEKTTEPEPKNSYYSLLNDYQIITKELFHTTKPADVERLHRHVIKSQHIYIVGLELNQNIARLLTHKFILLGLDVRAITTYDSFKLFSSFATKNDLFFVITLSGNHTRISSILEKIVEKESFIALISNYEKSICSVYADLTFIVPKTSMLYNHDSISRETLIIMLFDIFFMDLYINNAKCHSAFQERASFSQKNRDTDFSLF